jgi:hypothetical protein
MKKFPILFLVLALAAGFAAADDAEDSDDAGGIGFTAGLEFGIVGVNKPNDAENASPYLDVFVEYGNSSLDGALDVYASLLYDADLTEGGDPYPQYLTLDFMIGYNLGLGDSSTLSFILENENDFTLVPKAYADTIGIMKPGLKFNQSIKDTGDFYGQLDFPVAYLYKGSDKTYSGLDITLGWASAFDLGIEAGGHILFTPNDKISKDETVNGFTGISITASYGNGPIYADIAATVSVKKASYDQYYSSSFPYSYFDTLAGTAVSITPSFSYSFDFGLTAYVYCIFDGIGIKDSDVGIIPAIGVTYSF